MIVPLMAKPALTIPGDSRTSYRPGEGVSVIRSSKDLPEACGGSLDMRYQHTQSAVKG